METNVKAVELKELWRRCKEEGDERARERLVVAYSPLVKYVAGRMAAGLPSHVDEGDLISYGLIGLIGSIERYDLDRDIKFETFAVSRIKGAIIDELRSLDWVPRSVRSKARDVEKTHSELENRLGRAPTEEEMAQKLGVSVDDFRNTLLEIANSSVLALDDLPVDGSPEHGTPARSVLLGALATLWQDATGAKANAEAFAPLAWPAAGDASAILRARGRLELEGLGFSPSLHPLLLSPAFRSARAGLPSARDLAARGEAVAGTESVTLGRIELLGVKVAGKRTRTEKDGRLMSFITFSDETGIFEAVLYPDDYDRLARRLRGPGPFRISGVAKAELGEVLLEVKGVAALGGGPAPAALAPPSAGR